ncbi:NAD(P)/FAD-dependent oxidoreductase [Nocardioides marmoriginsengisoli]|uniref:Flavin-containing monooxygenase 5 n=1 Tax=Nocardioides marmoriginsengisoli TaxID=661483 RepID=A0A3N0CF69_9ACTN|nr:NAD(P)-binding domain-containing protein [Nocardioides marmoriginsengisoli]RNL62107.1 NAD(P)/FAD-dependent oxidoreductase [Nocardioides marmoriginsengisoli]
MTTPADGTAATQVCVIGAGSSGITAAQVLHARGVAFDCFEVGSEVGGNWRYDNDNQMSSAYASLHINTSRQLMEYAAYPMPETLPDYPSHRQIAAYFDAFVDHFGFRDRISFRTEVVQVEPVPGGGYDVTVRAAGAPAGSTSEVRTRRYQHVIVANGHHWKPRWPEPAFPGADGFSGEQLHAHHYRTPEPLVDKRVLVLGIGNSACDIAVESSRVAASTDLAMRRGAHIVPKFMLGVPTDHLTDSALARGPLKVQQVAMALMLRFTQGKVTDYGLPKPDHAVLHAHPTVSQDLLNRLGHGDLRVRPNIERFEGSTVFFADGSSDEYDVVVYCTGYQVSFPFLDSRVLASEDNHIDLYRRVVDPRHPGLYFIGLIQPLGAIMPLAEAQAEWVGDLITGVGALPSVEVMEAQIADYDRALAKRYVASKRHTIQVDFHAYRSEIAKERKRARRRMSRRA